MDAIISSALETICVQGQAGLSLASLWTELSNLNNNSLTPSFKASIYSNLLRIPSLQFLSPQNDPFDPNDAAIQLLEDAEKLGVKIVASLQLRDNFVGLYDTPAANANLSVPQRRTLERLAIARLDSPCYEIQFVFCLILLETVMLCAPSDAILLLIWNWLL